MLRQVWPGELLTVRPGVVLGPREPKGRLLWWLTRMRRGGRVLAPGDPDRPIQLIDVRDAAAFLVDMAGHEVTGGVNLAARPGHTTMGQFLQTCADVTQEDRAAGGRAGAELVWVPDEVLVAAGVREWTELPLWRPAPGTWAMSTELAHHFGLVCRPIEMTIADTRQWLDAGEHVTAHWRTAEHGIAVDKEERLLSAWSQAARPASGGA